MSEQSDTPRTDAAAERGSDLGLANFAWSGIWNHARQLERELAAATRERDEMRNDRDGWKQAARNEVQVVLKIARERNAARAEAERLRALQAACIAWREAREELKNPGVPIKAELAAMDARERVMEALAATEAK
jgi:hypothetical protein